MKAFNNKNMIYWEKNEDCAQYVLYLYLVAECYQENSPYSRSYITAPDFLKDKHKELSIGDKVKQTIDIVSISKDKTYYTFSDLIRISTIMRGNCSYTTGLNYTCIVTAEDRNGNKIDESNEVTLNI